MAINPMKMMQAKQAWDDFRENHPRFVPFLNAAQTKIAEGSVIAMSVTGPDGKVIETNIRVTDKDMELFNSLKDMLE
ncbi:MAG: hypothetical protein K6F92_02055 [Lachnospiraceae bacterium]|nr:hypothetical protein [Lachnospiraceae bacterium]